MLKNELHIPTKKYANLVQFTLNNSSASPISVDFGNNFPLQNIPTSPNLLPANSNVSSFNSGGQNFNSAINPNNYTIYVANSTNDVAVFDISGINPPIFINIGEAQVNIIYVPLNNCMYVAGGSSTNTYVIDCSTNTIIATILGADINSAMFFNPNNNILYGTGGSNNNVFTINVITNTLDSVITGFNVPTGITINLTSNLAYVVNTANDIISIINCNTNTVLGNIISLTPASLPQNIIYNTNNNLLYVSNGFTSSVAVCNPTTNTLLFDVTLIPVTQPLNPFGLALNTTTNELFITSQGTSDEQYSIFDCNTNSFVQTILIQSGIDGLNGIIFNAESQILYISGQNSNTVYAYNSVNTPQNQYYVEGSVDYNFFIQNLYYEPIKVEYIRMSTINSSIEQQLPFYNSMQMVEISATGQSKSYSNLPISRIDAQESQNIVLLPFKNLIMDGRTYLSNYVLNPYSTVTLDIYFNQLNLGSVEFYPHLYQPKRQLKDYIKAFNE
jgi:DNA-binding beta-propeller fold protein YncE